MSDSLLDGLRRVISGSFPDAPGANFAYVGLPLCRHPQMEFVEMLERIVWDIAGPEMRILLVTNAYEVFKHTEEPVGQATDVVNYTMFLSALESSLAPDGWVSRTREERLACLPRDSFIVMDLDPSLPCDCALALLGLVQWATGIDIPYAMPILISSVAEHQGLVADLIRMRDPSREVPITNLWEAPEYSFPSVQHTHEPDSDEAFFSAIINDLEADPKRTQLIISFGVTKVSETIRDRCEASRRDEFRCIEIGKWDIAFHRFAEIRSPEPGVTTIFLIVPPNITIIPPRFQGWDSVHVILEGRWDLPTWHDKFGEVAQFVRLLPNQHRWMQLWWAAQPGCGETSVWSSPESLNDFLQGGHGDHHLIDGIQLGGFMASVYDAERWGINPHHILYHFVGLGDRVNAMQRRLETQGVLSRRRFALQGQERSIFRKILPRVDYNHCVALFICLDAHPVVRSVKVDLAALLSQKDSLIGVMDGSIMQELRSTEGLFKKLANCCMGYAKSLAGNGPIWLQLGLWKRTSYVNGCLMIRRPPNNQAEWDSIFGKRLEMEDDAFPLLEGIRQNLRDAIGGLGLPTDVQELEDSNKGVELDSAQKYRVQEHLFRAFMHQTSVSFNNRLQQDQVEHCLLASQVQIKRPLSRFSIDQAFSTASLMDGSLAYLCVNPDLRVHKGVAYSWFWAMIPDGVVGDWMRANHPNGNLLAVLLTRNNGQREDVCELMDI